MIPSAFLRFASRHNVPHINMFGPRIGLVFSGGGGRGAYQIGVWQALKELKLDRYITDVSGTSVGALNALMFAQDDFDRALHFWTSLTQEQILTSKNAAKTSIEKLPSEYTPADYMSGTVERRIINTFLGSISFFSRSGLDGLLQQAVDTKKIKRRLCVCASNIGAELTAARTFEIAYAFLKRRVAGTAEFFECNNLSKEAIKKILLATSAIPIIFDPVEHDGNLYFDGGLTAHLPIEPLYTPRLQQIIAVNLFADIPSHIDQYSGMGFTYITPLTNLGSALTSSLAFNGETARKLIVAGYEESLNPLKKLSAYLKKNTTK